MAQYYHIRYIHLVIKNFDATNYPSDTSFIVNLDVTITPSLYIIYIKIR